MLTNVEWDANHSHMFKYIKCVINSNKMKVLSYDTFHITDILHDYDCGVICWCPEKREKKDIVTSKACHYVFNLPTVFGYKC